MIHFPFILQRMITYVTTLGGTLLGSATVHESEIEAVTGVDGAQQSSAGLLVLNADDWGRDAENTDRILDCVRAGTLSSASAMVFMEDSERAAALALQHGVDCGLHLNLTSPFTQSGVKAELQEHQQRVQRYLKGHKFAQVLYHPGLARSFEYVVNAQIEEYARLYGQEPQRLDGHHHMHLCANVLMGRLLPEGTLVRPSFSFYSGEKGTGNRIYRALVNGVLARRHRSAEYFFSLPPLAPAERLRRIFALARVATVEVETHPINPEEHRFLTTGEIQQHLNGVEIAHKFVLPSKKKADESSIRDRFACLLPYVFAVSAAIYESITQFSECF